MCGFLIYIISHFRFIIVNVASQLGARWRQLLPLLIPNTTESL